MKPVVIAITLTQRADRAVANAFPSAGRRAIARIFSSGLVLCDERRVRKGDIVHRGQALTLLQPPEQIGQFELVAEDAIPLKILLVTDDLVAINKPAGIPCHPLRSGETGTVANSLVARFPELAGIGDDEREAGLVHRLDTGTSGVLIACRSQQSWTQFRGLFSHGIVEKKYLALVAGEAHDGGCQVALVQRGPKSKLDPNGLPAQTEWRVVTRYNNHTLLECVTHTGRMHQVRAHLGHNRTPIIGDTLYGGPTSSVVVGHFLHASSILFPSLHIELQASLPPDREQALNALTTLKR